MLGFQDSSAGYTLPLANIIWYLGLLLIVWFMPNSQQLLSKFDPGVNPLAALSDPNYMKNSKKIAQPRIQINMTTGWGIIIGLLFTLGVMNIVHTIPFIYFQF